MPELIKEIVKGSELLKALEREMASSVAVIRAPLVLLILAVRGPSVAIRLMASEAEVLPLEVIREPEPLFEMRQETGPASELVLLISMAVEVASMSAADVFEMVIL